VRCGPRGVGNRPPVTGWRLGARAVVAERKRPRRLLRRLRASARTRCGPAVPHGWTSELHVGEAAFVVGRLVPGYRATRAQPARGGRCPRRWPPARRWRGEVGARPVGPGTRRDAARRQVAVGGPDRTPARSRAPAVGAVRTGEGGGDPRATPTSGVVTGLRRPRAARRRAGTAVGQGLRLLRRWPGQPPATPLRRKPVAGTGRRSHAAVSPNPVVGHRAGTGVGQPALRVGFGEVTAPTGVADTGTAMLVPDPCRYRSVSAVVGRRPAAEVRRVVPVRCVVPVVGFVVRVVEPAPVPVVPVVRHVVAVGRVVPPVVRGVVPVVRGVVPVVRVVPPAVRGLVPVLRAVVPSGGGGTPSVPRGWSAGAGRRVTPRGLPGLGHRRRHAGAAGRGRPPSTLSWRPSPLVSDVARIALTGELRLPLRGRLDRPGRLGGLTPPVRVPFAHQPAPLPGSVRSSPWWTPRCGAGPTCPTARNAAGEAGARRSVTGVTSSKVLAGQPGTPGRVTRFGAVWSRKGG